MAHSRLLSKRDAPITLQLTVREPHLIITAANLNVFPDIRDH